MNVGDIYTYEGPAGLAETLLGRPLTAEMTELDLHPGTKVTVREVEDDDTVHVEWTDRSGNPRATGVPVDAFSEHFTAEGQS